MNDRMTELYAGACLYAREQHPTEVPAFIACMAERFAELIVQECVNILDPNGEYTEKYKHSHTPGRDGLRTVLSQEHYFEMLASNKIKQHFGVEE